VSCSTFPNNSETRQNRPYFWNADRLLRIKYLKGRKCVRKKKVRNNSANLCSNSYFFLPHLCNFFNDSLFFFRTYAKFSRIRTFGIILQFVLISAAFIRTLLQFARIFSAVFSSVRTFFPSRRINFTWTKNCFLPTYKLYYMNLT